MKKIILLIFFLQFIFSSYSQSLQGYILTPDNKPIAGASIKLNNSDQGTLSDKDGFFSLNVAPGNKYVHLTIKSIGYYPRDTIVYLKNSPVKIILYPRAYNIKGIETSGLSHTDIGATYIKSKILDMTATATGNAVEALIMTSMGVQATNELSSQYSVRGGSYDENLVYIDGVEIIRPILIRSGQQEGLSIINPDFVENIKFSAGGFPARYGDKMSSVLDITYKTPDEKKNKFTVGFTGASLFSQTFTRDKRLSILLGGRIKQNAYLLNALPTKGNYKPLFSDLQTVINYKATNRLTFRWFNYMSYNQYKFIPDSLNIAVGTFTQNFRLPIAFNGQENDIYKLFLSAFTVKYRLTNNLSIRWINSIYSASEQEKYTIGALYRLDMVERQLNTNQDSAINIGLGYYLKYGRNFLDARVYQSQLKINWELNHHSVIAGIFWRADMVNDYLNRWKYIDSAGYSFNPYHSRDSVIYLYQNLRATNKYLADRIGFYAEDNFNFYLASTKARLNIGLRYTYWNYGNNHLFSPRSSLYLSPDWINKWQFRLSAGIYYQIPFYNELRTFSGKIVSSPRPQKAIHYLIGAYRNFKMWGRPFRFSSELYYKDLAYIIPFEYDNLRVQYYANQQAHGYATGLDFRLYGEFVPDVDSWISLSLMHTAEDIKNDAYWQYYDKEGHPTSYKPLAVDSTFVEPGYIPRPTDQLVTIGMFFQDYMPQTKNMRVSLALFYGTGHPYGPPTEGRYKAIYRTPPYIRSDIGFLYIRKSKKHRLKTIYELDLFNAWGVMNVASYNWLTIMTNPALLGNNPLGNTYMVQIAAPNYLTGRIINFKVKFIF